MQIIVNNLKIEYDIQGEGEGILFLHGWGTNKESFRFLVDRLKENYKIILLDLPGFGKSERPINWRLSDYVYIVKIFLEKLSLSPSVLVGHSFGGRIILKGIGSAVLGAKKIILISPAGVSVARRKNSFIKIVSKIFSYILYIPPFYFFREKLRRCWYKVIKSDFILQSNMQGIFKNVVTEDLAPYAKEIDIPTLIIWGEEDSTTPLQDGKKLHDLIFGSMLEIIKDTGHFSLEEKPEEVSNLIEGFI